jgi:hypothetical protein
MNNQELSGLSKILEDAQNYFSGCHDYRVYAYLKRRLFKEKIFLTHDEYDEVIKELVRILEI